MFSFKKVFSYVEKTKSDSNKRKCLELIAKVNDAKDKLESALAWTTVHNISTHITQYNPDSAQIDHIKKSLDEIATKAVSILLDKAFDNKLQGKIIKLDEIEVWKKRVNPSMLPLIDNRIDILNQTYRGEKDGKDIKDIREDMKNSNVTAESSRRKWERFIYPEINLKINGKQHVCRDWSIGGFALDVELTNVDTVTFSCDNLKTVFEEKVRLENIKGLTVLHVEGFNNNILKLIIELKKRGIEPR